ncbi:MAG: glycosyltransferase, partial [Actinomycetota bacterium]
MLPVFNEAGYIDRCLESLAAQDYQGRVEILVADGGSTDGSLDRLGEWEERVPSMRVFDNVERVQAAGLNLLAGITEADILIRADAHTTYATSYISASVAALRDSGADAVGGPMVPEGNTPFGQAVARAFRSRLGLGPAAFHHAQEPVEADTVYLGAMKTATFLEAGGMRRLPSRVAEDADFYYRLRKRGGRVIVDPAIRTVYTPRETPAALWRQFYPYGLGKADMLYSNGEVPS